MAIIDGVIFDITNVILIIPNKQLNCKNRTNNYIIGPIIERSKINMVVGRPGFESCLGTFFLKKKNLFFGSWMAD